MSEQDVYLDTSAITKRYMKERDSEKVDEIYRGAEMGMKRLFFSLWNLGESAVVFDKYRETADPKSRLQLLLDESIKLVAFGALEIIDINYNLVMKSAELALRHHIYTSDALQIASALHIGANQFVTADGKLARVAQREGLGAIKLEG